MRISTLVYARKGGEILLGLKKKGFGVGKWNGFGGKVNHGESIENAAVRELAEEAGIATLTADLLHLAKLHFRSGKEELNWDTHVFVCSRWQGEPIESGEMRPQWFHGNSIPYHLMWVDDIHWLPLVLAGKKIEATFYFNEAGDEIEKHIIKEVD